MSELTTNKSNSYLEQAAILLLCLGEEAAATVMQKLSREEVVRLSENMARLSGVKTSMARKVINNFFDEFREQSGINGASRSMLQGILNKALGTEIASSVINGIYGDEIRSRMARLQWVEPRQLAMLISEEHLQLQAVFLAFLTPEISAAVLSYLNESVQNEILYRVAKLNDVNRDVVDELDRLIERGLSVLSEHGSKVKGIKQAADIVNRFQGNQQVILDQMREREGAKLRADVEEKLARIESLVTNVEAAAPETAAAYEARLRQKLEAVLAAADIDESRIIAEAAIYADHVAVDEETVRLRSHIAQLRQMLESGSPVGRKADFLIQEFNREANTIGSKCQNADIAKVVVDLKSEIEKIREQIQNIE